MSTTTGEQITSNAGEHTGASSVTGPNGVHHLAITTADIKAQIDYFNDVLGAELVGLFWMHGVEGAWHCFLKLNDACYLSFVQTPEVAGIERVIGVTHAGNGRNPCAAGAMQHLALNVDTVEDLLAMRDRIRTRGITVMGPIDHGLCQSIYFSGLEDMTLEIATSSVGIDGRAWVDPEVVGLAGISEVELERYRNPTADGPSESPVAQPEFDPNMPYPRGYPTEVYEAMIAIPDDVLKAKFSINTPPVEV